MVKKILIINGPNLNALGKRPSRYYGSLSLDAINTMCREHGQNLKIEVDTFQSNCEGDLISRIQDAHRHYDGVIINPGGLCHTSVALMDAIIDSGLPTIEVHLSNIYRREEFRAQSYVSKVVIGVICGLGPLGYLLGIDALSRIEVPDNKGQTEVISEAVMPQKSVRTKTKSKK